MKHLEQKCSNICCIVIAVLIISAQSQDQCDTDVSLKIAFPYNSIFKTMASFYAPNASLYGKMIGFTYDSSTVQTSNAECVTKLNRGGLAFATAETPPAADAGSDAITFLSIPVMAGSLVFYFNLTNISNLILSPDVIADIYLGRVLLWNDASIQSLNPQLNLPAKKIIPVAEIAENAGTDLLGWCLSIYSDRWHQQFGKNKWQPQMNYTLTSSASSMMKVISTTPYTFGYTSLENIMTGSSNYWSITNVTILNWKGFAVDMNSKNIASTLRSLPTANVSNSDFLAYLMKNSISTTYPFIYFEYIVLYRTMVLHNSVSCCAMVEALGFVDYMLDFVKNATWSQYGFFNLPLSLILNTRLNVFPLITCNGTSTYTDLQQSRTFKVTPIDTMDTWEIIIPVAIGVILLTAALIGGYMFYQKRYGNNSEDLWKIDESEIVLIEANQKMSLSQMSIGTYQSADASTKNQSSMKNYMVTIGNFKRNDAMVCLTELKFESFSNWQQSTKRLVYKFTRDFNHPNLCSLFGVTTIQSKPCLVSQFCHKGTMNYVLEHCPFDLLLDIKYSLVNNILNGLKYLHNKLIVHGSLCSLTCFVDETWCVKIADWALFSITSKEPTKEKHNAQRNNTNGTILEIDEADSLSELIKVLYKDPDSNYPNPPTKSSDIYSFGMLLMEIFTRQLPYNEEVEMSETTYAEIIRKKMGKVECIPQMTKDVPNEIRPVIYKMIGPTESRPDITVAAVEIAKVCGNSNKNVVDVMMRLMEKHMEDLEEKVIERTSELVSITNRMKDLLNEMLPPQIAEKFISGVTVEPEFYECATIFFSDIVGFTTISARSTPYQVMNLLNDLWKLFDATIEKFDVYKVDTIGDAYMVASGLPVRNGIDHCAQVANFALFLLNESRSFTISHLPGETVRCRMGINSGPVTAGIVGHKMPQYCIFGDTVNTASRMESSSLPMKIHTSEFAHSLFESYFPQFIFELRGEIEVKGKGTMKTFWLIDVFKPVV